MQQKTLSDVQRCRAALVFNISDKRTVARSNISTWLPVVAFVLALAARSAVAALPAGWTDVDVGGPTIAGSANYTAGTWNVSGAGADIWGSADQFNFAYNSQATNYAVIIARITGIQNTDTAAKAGIMFRESTASSGAFAMVLATPSSVVSFQWRNTYGAQVANSAVNGITLPVYVKLVRSGNDFTGYYSPDGAAWTPIGPQQTIPMPVNAPAGLAVTSHNTAQLNTATFTSVSVANTPAPPPPPPLVFGIFRQLWTDVYGGGSVDGLTNIFINPGWPDYPNEAYTKIFTNLETEVDFLDYYGQRLRAFVIPPTNGNYSFWISSDDNSELYLSADETPTNITRIASVPGWTSSREWGKYPQQQSAPIYLESGRRYYLEALMAEGSGGDNLAVRWQLPDGSFEEPLTAMSPKGTRLIPFDGVELKPGIYRQATNMTLVEGQTAPLWVLVTNKSPVGYQWTLNNTPISGATQPFYTITNVTVVPNNGQNYRCTVTNSAGITNSAVIALTVIADTVKPTVVRTFNVGQTNLQIIYSEPVEALTATNTANYVFTNNLTVRRAVVSADNTSVILTTAPMVYGSNYTLVINGVRDRAVTPNVIATDTTVEFTAAPLATEEIGNPPIGTAITVVSNGFDITASGNDVGGTSDQFGYGYSMRAGNFDVAVRLAGLSLPDIWAKAGLMAREGMETASRFAAAFATPTMNGCFFEWRDTAYASTTMNGKVPANFPYTWLRLKRTGSTFTGFASYDGLNWMQLGSVIITMPNQVYLGLAVTSHNPTQTALAQFRDMLDVTNAVAAAEISPREGPGPSSRKTPIVISEIMYKPAPRADSNNLEFIEIYNSNPWFHDIGGYRLTGDNLSYTFPAGTVIQGGSFLVVAASPANMQSVYGINNVMGPYAGTLRRPDTLQLWDEQGALLLTVPYNNEHPWPVATDGTGHSLVLVNPTYGEGDPQAWDISDSIGGSPGRLDPYRPSPLRNVVINEWLAHTDPPDLDYIELYNHGNQPVDISGCILTDDPTTNKFVIPAGTVIPARGFAYTFLTNDFMLNAAGETIFFKNADGTRFIDAVEFGAQENGVAMGRWPDGAADFYRLIAKTPGTNNAAIRVGNVVINELMYHPISGNDDDQYVELYNRGATAVNLGGWEISDGISYTFPSNTVLAADSYLVVARNATRMMSNYPNLNLNNCLGNFNGKLAHSGERVALRMPDTIISTNKLGQVTTNFIHIAVNSVSYGTSGRWGEWSDGGGSSLELKDPSSNNRLAANWADSDETGKSAWANIEITAMLDNGANYEQGINHAQIGLLDRGECLVDNIEVRDGTGGANLVINPDFETGINGWSMQGAYARSVLDNSGYAGSGRSLRIRASGRLWTGANSCQMDLAQNGLGDGSVATMRFKARWLRGWPEVIMRLNGNWLEATGGLPVPSNLGTPGARNSRFISNAGPAIYAVSHTPALPAAGQPVVVTARVHDPGTLSSVQLFYRLDPTVVYSPVLMKDDGTGGDAVAKDGIFSATIAGQPGSTLAAFYVSASDTQLASTRFPALRNNGAPEPECLVRFGDTEPGGSFPAYHLWVNQTNSQRWYELSDLSNEEHDCTMVTGKRIIYNVLARFSGSPYHQGFDYPDGYLCHYKWTFPDDDKFLGATSFNKIHQPGNGAGDDTSIQREQLANTFLRTLGVPWLYRHHVAVYVNGNRRGSLMEDAQTPDADVVEQYFPGDSDGWLYKMQPWFEFGPDPQGISIPFANMSWCNLMPYTTTGGAKKTARYRYMFLVRRTPGSANDFTNVFSLVDAASSYGTPNYVANMENLADMENWMRVFAANHAAGNWDAYGAQNSQNLYGYMGTKGTRYSLLMFDFNIVIGNSGSWGPGQNLFTVNSQDQNTANIYQEPTFLRMYWRALQELVNGPLDVSKSGPLLDAKYNSFVMNGLNVENPNAAIKGWLTLARESINSQLAMVNAGRFTLDPGYTLTNNVAYFTGTAPINIRTVTINGGEYPISWTSLTRFRVGVPLQEGSNQLNVAGVDMDNNAVPGASTNVTAVFNGTVPSPAGQIAFSEIMYHGVTPGAEYVELFNTSSNATYDLSNWRVNGLGYTFPPGSSIRPRAYLMLAANSGAYSAAYGATAPPYDVFSGKLQTDGETLTLIQPGSNPLNDVVIDKVRYGTAAPWPKGANSAGTSLQLVDLKQDHWRVANWSAVATNMTAEPQWIYVTSVGTVNSSTLYMYLQSAGDIYIDDIKLVMGQTPGSGVNLIPNGDFESVFPGPWIVSPNLAGSSLSPVIRHSGGAALHLVASAGGTGVSTSIRQTLFPALVAGQTYALSFWYLQTPNGGPLTVRIASSGVGQDVNPAPPATSMAVATPAAPNSVAGTLPAFPPLWINEVQAVNLTGITNSAGQRTPWIEIFNPTTNAVPLYGLVLANNYTNLTQWAFPNGAVINPRQFKVVFADGQTNLSTLNELHAGFALPPGAGNIALSRVTTNGLVHVLDYLTYTNLTANRSFGSLPDAQIFERQEFFYPTPGATNIGNSAPLTVRINEWMADNLTTLADPADSQYEDWFELYNYGNGAVDLYDFYLSDSLTNQTQYHVTGHYVIPPHGFLLVWADGESGQNSTNRPDLHVNFKLAKEGEAIGLFASDGTTIDYVEFGPQTTDVTMGRLPDGGDSVGFLSVPTPGTANKGNMPPVLAPIADQAIFLGQTVVFTASATDEDQPPQTLGFSLGPGAPTGAQIGATSGQFTWTPDAAPSTNRVTVVVTDSGTPSRSASQAFTIVVYEPPALSGVGMSGGQFAFGFSTVPGHTYQVEYCENLTAGQWIALGNPIAGTGEVITINSDVSTSTRRFYRVRVQ